VERAPLRRCAIAMSSDATMRSMLVRWPSDFHLAHLNHPHVDAMPASSGFAGKRLVATISRLTWRPTCYLHRKEKNPD
jgi:hypothetical protein